MKNCMHAIAILLNDLFQLIANFVSIVAYFKNKIKDFQSKKRVYYLSTNPKILPRSYREKYIKPEAFKKAEDIIRNLKENGELGLEHLGILSEIVHIHLRVYDKNNKLLYQFGNKYKKSVKVQFFDKKIEKNKGHYVPKNENPDTWILEPEKGGGKKNNCLLDAICSQTGDNPLELRERLADKLRQNAEKLCILANDITRLENSKKNHLIRGGLILNCIYDINGQQLKRIEDIDANTEYIVRLYRLLDKDEYNAYLTGNDLQPRNPNGSDNPAAHVGESTNSKLKSMTCDQSGKVLRKIWNTQKRFGLKSEQVAIIELNVKGKNLIPDPDLLWCKRVVLIDDRIKDLTTSEGKKYFKMGCSEKRRTKLIPHVNLKQTAENDLEVLYVGTIPYSYVKKIEIVN